jgi:hypothetical protein
MMIAIILISGVRLNGTNSNGETRIYASPAQWGRWPLLNDNIPVLRDILTLFQTIHYFGGWDTAAPEIFKTSIEPTSFSV